MFKRHTTRTRSSKIQRKIKNYLINYPNSSRNEVASGTGLKVATVCSTVHTLIRIGVVEVTTRSRDEASSKLVQKLSVSQVALV